jgi:lipopolysaccharide/colanic/teichoic acid biosynthesis glycosyltransferase
MSRLTDKQLGLIIIEADKGIYSHDEACQKDGDMQNQVELNRTRISGLDLVLHFHVGADLYYFIKRTLDILVAGGLLIIFIPVMLTISILIYLYSPGPIFYKQERVGAKRVRRGNTYSWERVTFPLYKFRTMKVNVDEGVHKAYVQALIRNDRQKMIELQGEESKVRKLTNDSRIIFPGKFLRKFSLDELPQFWNVLRGDMSLIGPRPALPYEVEVYEPWHLRRLEAQPGISGLQQVTARCTADFDEQVRLDLEYINNPSLWLDLKIALKTPLMILSTRGAG